jgi:superoxide dismutase, Cu-Zn family
MPHIRSTALPVAALMAASCSSLADVPTARVGQASLSFANGLPAGTAQLLRDGSGLRIVVAATGMTPGAHGFHLHTTGRCEAPGFTSAGGHLNPSGRKHGTQAPGGPHLGDLPNIQINANGSGAATEIITGGDATLSAIFDADGTAVIIHANADDYVTDPTGNAGDRVACGVLRRAG